MATQVILEFPGELPEEVLCDPEILKEGKAIIVLKMLKKGAISQTQATDLLGIDRNALFDLANKYGISGIETIRQESEDPTIATAGSWKDLLDCQTFERDIYASRLRHTRPEVKL